MFLTEPVWLLFFSTGQRAGEWKQGDEIAGIAIIWMSEIVPVLGGDRM